jgi:hypothetical protein
MFFQAARIDSNNELMVHQFLHEEATADADQEEHIVILIYLLYLQAAEDTAPICGVRGWAKEIEV